MCKNYFYWFIFLFIFTHSVSADSKDQWEFGVGTTAFTVPVYPGSSQDESFIIPFPFLRVKTEYFEMDEGIRGYLFESPDARLNISADFAVPADSDESTTRNGMEDLKPVVQIGPSLELVFLGGRRQPYEFRFSLPVRTAIASDIENTENIGWVAEPRLTYETMRSSKTGFAYQVTAGLQYSSQDYNAYYYDVPVSQATALRPAYESEAGYGGYFFDLVLNWRDDNLVYFAFTRYKNLENSSFEDSPLIEDNNYFSAGIGLAWIFASSF